MLPREVEDHCLKVSTEPAIFKMDMQIRIIEDEIRDLQRIVDADLALLELQKSPDKRMTLSKEIGALEYKIDRLREKIRILLSG
jgi:hypothetical protein